MPRHNRTATGVDQCGFSYDISYQPDWVSRIKITRRLASGRQSTKVLFRNPARSSVEPPPAHVRVAIFGHDQNLEVDCTVGTSEQQVRSLRIDWVGRADPNPLMNHVTFTILPFRAK